MKIQIKRGIPVKHKGLIWIIMIAVVLFLATKPDFQTASKKLYVDSKQEISKAIANINARQASNEISVNPQSNSSSSLNANTNGTTPTEDVIHGHKLSNVYYYHFADNTPQDVRKMFLSAVNIYNQTGLVKLIAGAGTQQQNQIKFSIYDKKMTSSQRGTIELGLGGPEVIQQSGVNAYTVNHASASLNMQYIGSIRLSVAVHELGHALGLAHSGNRNSVMYPVDQGRTTLSKGDLAGLKTIYK